MLRTCSEPDLTILPEADEPSIQQLKSGNNEISIHDSKISAIEASPRNTKRLIKSLEDLEEIKASSDSSSPDYEEENSNEVIDGLFYHEKRV